MPKRESLSVRRGANMQSYATGLEHRYKESFVYPSQVRSGLKTWFEEVWDVEKSNNRKLFLKKSTELYLTLNLGYWESKRIAQFRTSSHRYNIETGRYGEKRNDVQYCPCEASEQNWGKNQNLN